MFDGLKQKWELAKTFGSEFSANKSGASIMNKVIELSIALIVFSIVGVLAITTLSDANTTGWDATVVTIYGYLPIFFILAIAISVIYAVVHARKG